MTIKELAAELGRSKTYINNLINDMQLKDELTLHGNRYDIPESTADKIRAAINGKAAEQQEQDISFYKEQLQKKDEMIERLQQENMELVKTLQQHTYLLAQSTTQKQEPPEAAAVVPAETTESTVEAEDHTQNTRKAGFFSRFWRR